ncbi:MAG: hypothetical protein IPK80_01875 [Nannocystis sp.]|nr:hypothetical protein [Nannocystis sp.]
MIGSFFDGQILPYPAQDLTFELGQGSDTLRIGWGEIGQNPEGLFPWWSGPDLRALIVYRHAPPHFT